MLFLYENTNDNNKSTKDMCMSTLMSCAPEQVSRFLPRHLPNVLITPIMYSKYDRTRTRVSRTWDLSPYSRDISNYKIQTYNTNCPIEKGQSNMILHIYSSSSINDMVWQQAFMSVHLYRTVPGTGVNVTFTILF